MIQNKTNKVLYIDLYKMNQEPNPNKKLFLDKLKIKPIVKPPQQLFINMGNPPQLQVKELEEGEVEEELTPPPPTADINDIAVVELVKREEVDPEIKKTFANFRDRIKDKQNVVLAVSNEEGKVANVLRREEEEAKEDERQGDEMEFLPAENTNVPPVLERQHQDATDARVEEAPAEEVEFIPATRKTKTKKQNVKGGPKTMKNKKGIADIPDREMIPFGKTSFRDRMPQQREVTVSVPSFYMNNRKMFVQVINGLFDGYKQNLLDESQNVSCDTLHSGSNISLMTHQQIVRDYMNLYTPYRGLLLYHGLGAGKTCTSIGIAEGMKSFKKVLIMTPASLQSNYYAELKKCGDMYYKKHQYWEWISIEDRPELLETLSKLLNLDMEFIISNRGAWLINVSIPESNYENLLKYKNRSDASDNVSQNQFSLNAQLDKMIQSKYEFINYNGLRAEGKNGYNNRRADGNIFSNKVVIIDEAHNLISRIVNQINKQRESKTKAKTESRQSVKDHLSIRLYKDLMSAKNCKIVFLSGTPIINYPNEIAIMFNILRGSIETYEFNLEAPGLDLPKIKYIFKDDVNLDYIDYKPSTNELTITRNPLGFQNYYSRESRKYRGVAYSRDYYMNEEEFIAYIIETLKSARITVKSKYSAALKKTVFYEKKVFKALPDNLEEFKSEFIDSQENNVYTFKNPLKFKYRIMGLTSYFRSAQEELLPRYEKSENLHIVEIPMSQYQFSIYEMERHKEREKEQKSKKGALIMDSNGVFIEPTSTFKIFSRLACNFVEPAGMPRPKPLDHRMIDASKECKDEDADICNFEPPEQAGETPDEQLRVFEELEADEIMALTKDGYYQANIKEYIAYIKTHGRDILSKDGLEIHSPKFLAMLNNIQNPSHLGLHLVYSQLRSIEGIELFSCTLEQNGFTQFKIKQVNQTWVLDMDPALLGTPMYALYTGTEGPIEREILRNIYNGSWKDIPKSLADVIRPVSPTNNMGQLIKVLMITSAGSEGINLLNTRYVHIMEPYWHPVRTEQVIGRARRICSHQSLPPELRTVDVFIYLMKLTPEQYNSDIAKELRRFDESKKLYYIGNPDDVDKSDRNKYKRSYFTSDQTLFEISNIKEELNSQLLKAVKESSIDCATHVKSSSKEQLTCLSFGDLRDRTDDYSYKPDIKKDLSDKENELNTRNIELSDLILITVKGVEYAFHEPSKYIYDLQSYNYARTTQNLDDLRHIGIMRDGKLVFNRK